MDDGLYQHLDNGVHIPTGIGEEYPEGQLDAAGLEAPDEERAVSSDSEDRKRISNRRGL
ncbi:MAG: hypothetical protein V5A55_13410 [Halovenus sp.]